MILKLLSLVVCICLLTLTSGCGPKKTVIIEQDRISGPLSDTEIPWEESDYK